MCAGSLSSYCAACVEDGEFKVFLIFSGAPIDCEEIDLESLRSVQGALSYGLYQEEISRDTVIKSMARLKHCNSAPSFQKLSALEYSSRHQ